VAIQSAGSRHPFTVVNLLEEGAIMNITAIEGIGPANANKLGKQGIKTTEALLKVAGSATGRRDLAAATKLAEEAILEWVNRADLMRVKGVGEEYSDLLEVAGVDTVKELRRRNPANLHKAMLAANEEKNLVRRPPSLSEVERWIEYAKTLEPAVTY
jgi:predicted flap endonuclease-1-like 5' DNA nuclease